MSKKKRKKRKMAKGKPAPVVPETSESEFDGALKALQLGRADSQH